MRKRLIPFILQQHNIEDVLFWLDLAAIAYAGIVTDFLKDATLVFVAKNKNPPNFPQALSVEMFWAECKRFNAGGGVDAKNIQGFKLILQKIATESA